MILQISNVLDSEAVAVVPAFVLFCTCLVISRPGAGGRQPVRLESLSGRRSHQTLCPHMPGTKVLVMALPVNEVEPLLVVFVFSIQVLSVVPSLVPTAGAGSGRRFLTEMRGVPVHLSVGCFHCLPCGIA